MKIFRSIANYFKSWVDRLFLQYLLDDQATALHRILEAQTRTEHGLWYSCVPVKPDSPEKVEKNESVEIGESYVFMSDNPFQFVSTVKVVDVKSGYVQYSFPSGVRLSLEENTFLQLYKKVQE